MRRAGENWTGEFEHTLSPQQADNWNEGLRNGTPPEALIDFHHFKYFAIKNKDLLKADFGRKVNYTRFCVVITLKLTNIEISYYPPAV